MIYHKKLLQGEAVAVVTYAKSTVTDLTLKILKRSLMQDYYLQ